MSPLVHRLYIGTLVSIVLFVTIFLLYRGIPYYSTPLEERFYHPDHVWFKPSGIFGQGLGIAGTLLILIGVFGYMAKKKYRSLARLGRLKYWLEFHIFLCSLGPVLILFHTAFKFGGLISIGFWSMVAVVASGVVGRFIYVQIPRSIEGRALSLQEVQAMKMNLGDVLRDTYGLDEESRQSVLEAAGGKKTASFFKQYLQDKMAVGRIKKMLRSRGLPGHDLRKVAKLIRNEISLNRRIERLQTMQKLFKYWHVAHLPFALIMLIIMAIHVAVSVALGYRWIF